MMTASARAGVAILRTLNVVDIIQGVRTVTMIGSKHQALPVLRPLLRELPVRSVLDAFSGSGIVGADWKRLGYTVHSNDSAPWSELIGMTYIAADGSDALRARIAALIAQLRQTAPIDGTVAARWGGTRNFFSVANARLIDAYHAAIPALTTDRVESAILRTALMEAADRVCVTLGTQVAPIKTDAPKRHQPIEVCLPDLIPGTGSVSRMDATECVRQFAGDLVYLDPPYNEHRYERAFPIWTYLSGGDPAPASDWNDPKKAAAALAAIVAATRAPYLLLSYSDAGFLSREVIITTLATRGHVGTVSVPVKGYPALRLDRVRRAARRWTTETHYLVGPDAASVVAAVAAAERVAVPIRAGRHVYDLRDAIRQGMAHRELATWALVAIVRDDGWRHYQLPDCEPIQHGVFSAFLDAIGTDFATLMHLCRDDLEALDALDRVMQNPAHRPKKTVDNGNSKRPDGNTRQRALRALRARCPELHARVLNGELSPHRAMVEAGLRRPTRTVPADNVDAVMRAAVKQYGLARVCAALSALEAGDDGDDSEPDREDARSITSTQTKGG
jgi:adenine-specific DNA-methyltransferase